MLDYKIRTFLKVCETMNYRKAAEELNMSQPSITQHIQALENFYNTIFFIYDKKKLIKTQSANILEKYSLSMRANEQYLCRDLLQQPQRQLRIGATKSIGNYVINDKIKELINDYSLTFVIDNTYNLLGLLNQNKLDLLLVEGLFDKNNYGYQLYKKEKFVGICSDKSPLKNKSVQLVELFNNTLLLREKGSGTRDIFESEIRKFSYSINQFAKVHSISSFDYILDLVKKDQGISFVFSSVANNKPGISTFTLKNEDIEREFNFVYLKNTNQNWIIDLFTNT